MQGCPPLTLTYSLFPHPAGAPSMRQTTPYPSPVWAKSRLVSESRL